MKVEQIIAKHEADLIAFRRHMHTHPELSCQEFETTENLKKRLERLGLDVFVRPEGNGLYADLVPDGFDPEVHKTVAIRSDIDALPILEKTDLAFASEKPGVMHACGHDMHMACVMGAVLGLTELRASLPGRIRFFYQHNEESHPGGADELVEFGAMKGVDHVLGLHCDPELEVGRIGVRVGALTAAHDSFDLVIRGKGGHSARPHQSIDPVAIASQAIVALYQGFDRALDARDPVVLNVSAIHAGDAHNIIPSEVTMRGTVRSLSKENRSAVEPLMRRILGGVCAIYGGEFELSMLWGSASVLNHAAVVDVVRKVGHDLLGKEQVYEIPLPSMGGEDFSAFLDHAPGAMFRLGTAGDESRHLLHSPRFNPDERAICIGASVLARSALKLMGA